MRTLEEILSTIRLSIEAYENLPLDDTVTQSDILRVLTCNLFYLEAHRVQAHKTWHKVYFECESKVNAVKEREADRKVQELYMIRRLMTSGYRVVDSIRSTISIHKKER